MPLLPNCSCRRRSQPCAFCLRSSTTTPSCQRDALIAHSSLARTLISKFQNTTHVNVASTLHSQSRDETLDRNAVACYPRRRGVARVPTRLPGGAPLIWQGQRRPSIVLRDWETVVRKGVIYDLTVLLQCTVTSCALRHVYRNVNRKAVESIFEPKCRILNTVVHIPGC